jgi:hypothetical protein
MPRHPDPENQTPEQELRDLLKWAEQQDLNNAVAVLRRVLAKLEARDSK